MGWKGTWNGLCWGTILGGAKGAMVGAILGDIFEESNAGERKLQCCYHAFFQCLGCLAGNDENKSQFAGRIMQVWNFADELANECLAQCGAGRHRDFSSLAAELNNAANYLGDADFKSNATKLMCMLISIDSPLSRQYRLLKDACRVMGTSGLVESFFDEYYIYNRQSGISTISEEESYRILGVSVGDSNSAIKQAFREKSLRLPLSIEGVGITNEFTENCEAYFRKVAKAYKTLCLARNIK